MELAITVNLGKSLPLNKLVQVYERSHEKGYPSPDAFITDLLASSLEEDEHKTENLQEAKA